MPLPHSRRLVALTLGTLGVLAAPACTPKYTMVSVVPGPREDIVYVAFDGRNLDRPYGISLNSTDMPRFRQRGVFYKCRVQGTTLDCYERLKLSIDGTAK